MISEQTIEAFKQEMQNAGVAYQFVNYPGAKHGFTNPGADAIAAQFNLPVAYNADADRDSWQKLQQLLNAAFGR
jgi:dienelactone hydrolase